MRPIVALSIFLFLISASVTAQNASIFGQVKDAETGELMFGVNVVIQGTSIGTVTDFDGKYEIADINPGHYNVEVSFLGYEKKVFTGIKLEKGTRHELNVEIGESALTIDQEIVIVGDRPLVDVNNPKNQSTISAELIESAPVKDIQGILNTQTGVVQQSEGIHIRGGRTYETGFYIDGVSAKDPLAGTGFGIDLGTNSVKKIEVSTSSNDVEFGDATSGVVNTKTKSGSDEFELNLGHKRDWFGFNENWNSVFKKEVTELSLGGPMKLLSKMPGDFKFFTSWKFDFSDEFTKNPADQVVSSLYQNEWWTPYQDNRWSGMLKLNYQLNPRKKVIASYVKSLVVNQNTNMLRITRNDVSFRPGYQYRFSLQPDNANTYTHDTNLENVQWWHTVSNRLSYKVTFARLYVHLRADANGADWRPENVDSEFDPQSIVDYPSDAFNPDDSIVFVNPAPGLYNNGGIATLWHDHYVVEYTGKAVANIYSKNTFNTLTIGTDFKYQDMQWIDISRPWIGAPIELPNGDVTQSFRLGDFSDVWKVKPSRGAFFLSDHFKFKGLIAEIGGRLEYWFAGKFVDDAVENPTTPIRQEIREQYRDETIKLGNRRMKMRFLPKVSASFPIKENQMMFFSYSHSTVSPHPSYIYGGLDPLFTDRSTLSRLGNPALDPEVDISYELGIKSQLTANDALNVTAFWKDKYDFITSASVLVEDATGREVSRTIKINSDYARVRGLELTYIKRVKKWFNGQFSLTYSVATGQSSSSSENIQEIVQTGIRESTRETPLAWDSPLDLKAFTIFTLNKKDGLRGHKWMNKMSLYAEFIYRTGRRYTPYEYVGEEPSTGRPIYEQVSDPEKRFSENGKSSFWLNANYKKWWNFKKITMALTVEVTNILNSKNTAIVNPVTGRAYETGDDVPSEWRDPRFLDPRDPRSNNVPPDNPARFHEQRHFLIGLSFGI